MLNTTLIVEAGRFKKTTQAATFDTEAYLRTGKLVEVPDLDSFTRVLSYIAQNEAYQSNHRPSAIPGQRARPEPTA